MAKKEKKPQINITNIQRKSKIDLKLARYIVEKSIESLYCGLYEIDLVFCSPAYIRKLNGAYRGKDAETDVLSFSLIESGGPFLYIGEIYIAPYVAEKNFLKYKDFWEKGDWISKAADAGKRRPLLKNGHEKELALLIIHGILHLFGYDHDEEHRLSPDDSGYDKDMKLMQNLLYKKLTES